MSDFDEKREIGEEAEDVFYRLMMKKCRPEIADFKIKSDDVNPVELRWDQVIYLKDGRKISFEVKFDEESESTGNAAVEYMSLGTRGTIRKPSGLWATESDYWVHVVWVPNRGWRHFYAPSSALRNLLLEEEDIGLVPRSSSKGVWYDRVTKNWRAQGRGNPLVGLIILSTDRMLKSPWRCVEDLKDGSWDFLEIAER